MFVTALTYPWSAEDRGPVHGSPFFRFLDDNGDGTGTKNANGDFSGALEEFFIQPAAGQEFWIMRLIVQIRQSAVLRAERYIPLAALVNGIAIQKLAGAAVLNDLTDGLPVMAIADWGRNCFDQFPSSFGAGDNYFECRWTFANSGLPVRLLPGQRLAARLNDNFTTLVTHTFKVDGVSITGQQ